ncbi:CHAPERONE DNAJ-DOMAIN SUPERFAMILY PROTEIN [Salix viminalis]|uniref:CHAPERONE DNAJ-DOMAIN SUPERFAMILY PROTEIN n=1 Tax=Salix viminalis TaxID=40686 RepID=A0A9Q0UHS0_SALVM|nr:CHAPERONE DNAJ-DOMAIN SUPERFAMILY PROTEIN [Salix viminalis]
MGGEEINRSKDNPWPSPNRPPPYHEKSEDMSLWGVVIFGLIGATATTYAARRLRWTIDELYAQLTRSQSTWKGATGSARSFRTYFQEEAWKNYNRRMQEAYEEETERVERIRRMQSVFNRERNKEQRTNFRRNSRDGGSYSLSHHYSILGLDRSRTIPYTEAEIKTAFRTKAKEFHPDQNQDNKEAAEAKFKEVMISYEAIKEERKNTKY